MLCHIPALVKNLSNEWQAGEKKEERKDFLGGKGDGKTFIVMIEHGEKSLKYSQKAHGCRVTLFHRRKNREN